jgi:putative IMPACT (imprinted ancient) family translation regulator
VVRYFGGIKLGIGGLIRAYGQTARDCLRDAEKIVYVPSVHLEIEMPYAHIGPVVNLVSRLKGKILNMDHGEKTKAVVHIGCTMVPPLEEGIRAISGDISVKKAIRSEGLL